MTGPTQHYAEAFGFGWRSDIALPAFHGAEPASWAKRGLSIIAVEQARKLAERTIRVSLPTSRLRQICSDGARIAWGEEAVFDLIGCERVSYYIGPGWTGTMPTGFYATVAACASAWRGDIPLHASAVAWRGRAVLITGPAGAGKSTSVAAMLAAGAQLVSDDLTVLASGDEAMMVRRGRPAMRLHKRSLPLVEAGIPAIAADDGSDKWIVRPVNGWDSDELPLGQLLVIGDSDCRIAPIDAVRATRALLFRPRMQAAIPGFAVAMAQLMRAAARHPVAQVATIEDFSHAGLIAHGRRLLALADSLHGDHPVAPPA